MAQLTTLLMSLLTLFLSTPGVISTTFTILNKCDYTVWPGIQSSAGIASLSTTGFALQKDESRTITAPASWGGRFWGRTHCSQDSTGKFSCVTADCSSGKVECAGNNALPPATLAEFKLDGYGGLDFFDVSLVDGYNLPMLVVPQGGKGQNCTSSGCVSDLNESCPSELKVTSSADGGESVACKSACAALDQDQYCCRGAYGTPDTCKPSTYSQIFKTACPNAYSYAYDDKTSTFTCGSSPDYTITFCPTPYTRATPLAVMNSTKMGSVLPQDRGPVPPSIPNPRTHLPAPPGYSTKMGSVLPQDRGPVPPSMPNPRTHLPAPPGF